MQKANEMNGEAGTAAAIVENTLADLDISEAAGATELSADDEAALALVNAKDEVYEDKPTPTVTSAPTEAATSETKKERKARAPRDVNSIDAAHFVLTHETPANLEDNKIAVIAERPNQKKIAEKFDNLFQARATGKAPSVYVMACFEVLDKAKTATSSDFVNALKATSSKKGAAYSEGTARSQAGQIMVLFDKVGIADRSKQTLTMRTDSAIADYLRGLLAAA